MAKGIVLAVYEPKLEKTKNEPNGPEQDADAGTQPEAPTAELVRENDPEGVAAAPRQSDDWECGAAVWPDAWNKMNKLYIIGNPV